MEVLDTCYVSTACNRTCHAANWGQNNLICYGSCNAVCIYKPEVGNNSPCEITQTLCGHTDRVNCVNWIKNTANCEETEFVSGSVDKSVIVWKKENDKFVEKVCLKGHSLSVNAVCGIHLDKESQSNNKSNVENIDTIIASSSTDSTVKIWRQSHGEDFKELQTISFGSGFSLDVVLTVIPNTQVPILACGADDQKIHIFTFQEDTFVKSIVITGHEDWVRGLDFSVDNNGDLLLASCGQDNMIRIWRFSRRESSSGQPVQSVKDLTLNEDIKMQENTFTFDINGQLCYYAVILESVLSGHDNWIYSVKWQKPFKSETGELNQSMSLLSASMDKTMIVWKPDPEAHVWVEQVRVGEVGGNTLGFYGGMFGPDGQSIMAHGYHGAFHHWSFNDKTKQWDPSVTGGGHFNSVEDIDWDKDGGQFLLSTSTDQTTRLHAPWVVKDRPVKWYEIARPQVHGYDLQCLTMINRYQFASGADEKVPRVFGAPKNFLENFCRICGENLQNELNKKEAESLPEGASVPALGLSNKAVFSGDVSSNIQENTEAKWNEQYPEVFFNPLSISAPPSEENLLQNTLWPETQKLYGHGYEIFSIASNPSGTILATACKATKAEYANILLWDTTTYKQVGSLEGSTLTVTQLAFSHNGQYLLAVSRDRTWSLYSQTTGDSGCMFEKVAYVDKKTTSHSRIIWSCSWTWNDEYFITSSRDKKVMIWCVKDVCDKNKVPKPTSILDLTDSVTAVDIASKCFNYNTYLISVGLESGCILLYKWNPTDVDKSWTRCAALNKSEAHHLAVKRLKFRQYLGLAPDKKGDNSSILQLASCSADHGVKIYNIHLDKL
ncbi:elongator complex protein 2 [Patella vulgata]|uniref:elongator complex protein 2 n=1 Tax=Patella vulgata TaxID=6465 RepID=UPI0024A9F61E|nr:elongator complex protein 2 [Patella vulgata]